jgi:hypothetical protein
LKAIESKLLHCQEQSFLGAMWETHQSFDLQCSGSLLSEIFTVINTSPKTIFSL